MKRESLELKVGVFVLAAILLLVGMVVKAGDLYLKPGYSLRLVLDSVNGIEKGSSVRLAGVPIGEVKSIRAVRSAEGDTHAEAEAYIVDGVLIEEDAELRVGTMGFLGEKYIQIMPGAQGSKTLVDGSTLAGKRFSNVDDVFDAGKILIDKMHHAASSIDEVVSDPEFKTSVKGTFVNGEVAAKNLRETSDDLRDAAKSAKIVLARLRDGEGTVGKLLKDDKIAKDLEAFVADIKKNPWKLLKKS